MKSGNFGPQLLKVLKHKNMSQVTFAQRIKCPKSVANMYVKGRRDPSLDTLLKMLTVLEITLEDLFSFSKHEENRNKDLRNTQERFNDVANGRE